MAGWLVPPLPFFFFVEQPGKLVPWGRLAQQMDRHRRNRKQRNRQHLERKGKCLQRTSCIRTKCNLPLIVRLPLIFSVTFFFLPHLISPSPVENSFPRLWKSSFGESEWMLKVWMQAFCPFFYLLSRTWLSKSLNWPILLSFPFSVYQKCHKTCRDVCVQVGLSPWLLEGWMENSFPPVVVPDLLRNTCAVSEFHWANSPSGKVQVELNNFHLNFSCLCVNYIRTGRETGCASLRYWKEVYSWGIQRIFELFERCVMLMKLLLLNNTGTLA